jgi:hypothetical protein
VFASIKAGTYATDYAIGDMIPLDLGSEGLINMQIAAFDADDLADGSGKAHITWIAKELLPTTKPYNSNQKTHNGVTNYTAGGWELSDIRNYLGSTVYNKIPVIVRDQIKEVNKIADNGYNDQTLSTVADKVWIPSLEETGANSYKYCVTGQGTKYPIFVSNTDREKGVIWWTRSICINSNNWICCIKSDGSRTYSQTVNAQSICLCFCT